jgi:hypothetical protein
MESYMESEIIETQAMAAEYDAERQELEARLEEVRTIESQNQES